MPEKDQNIWKDPIFIIGIIVIVICFWYLLSIYFRAVAFIILGIIIVMLIILLSLRFVQVELWTSIVDSIREKKQRQELKKTQIV